MGKKKRKDLIEENENLTGTDVGFGETRQTAPAVPENQTGKEGTWLEARSPNDPSGNGALRQERRG